MYVIIMGCITKPLNFTVTQCSTKANILNHLSLNQLQWITTLTPDFSLSLNSIFLWWVRNYALML